MKTASIKRVEDIAANAPNPHPRRSARKMKITGIVVFAMLAQVALASPRIIPSHSNLFERADMVIVGKFVKTDATDTHRKIRHFDTVEAWSTFDVITILKGSPSNSVVSIMHYKQVSPPSDWDAVRTTVGTPFSLISFTKQYEHYMIYLKSDGKGGSLPVTGAIDPQFSFWKLEYKKETYAEQ